MQDNSPSTFVANFLDYLKSAASLYRQSIDGITEMDGLTQDLLHKLELEDLTYHQRAKLAAELVTCRQKRREYKDTVELLEPLVNWSQDHGKGSLNLLRETLGKMRRIETKHQVREYHPRVMQKEETS